MTKTQINIATADCRSMYFKGNRYINTQTAHGIKLKCVCIWKSTFTNKENRIEIFFYYYCRKVKFYSHVIDNQNEKNWYLSEADGGDRRTRPIPVSITVRTLSTDGFKNSIYHRTTVNWNGLTTRKLSLRKQWMGLGQNIISSFFSFFFLSFFQITS